MEFTGINFLLILLAPLGGLLLVCLIIFTVLSPLMKRVYDQQYAAQNDFKQQVKEIKAEREEILKNVKERKKHYTKEELQEINARHKEIISAGSKRMIKAGLQDSGFYELKDELNKDLKDIFD